MTILNRPIIILKGEYGFLGLKNNKIEANRPTYDSSELKQTDTGLYIFKGKQHLLVTADDLSQIWLPLLFTIYGCLCECWWSGHK